MSLIPFGFWAASGAGAGNYWLATLGGASSETAKSGVTDSENNLYAFGYSISAGSGLNDFFLAKYDTAGAVQWQRVLGGSGQEQGFSNAIDSLDNIYVAGYTGSTGAGGNDFLFAKYSSAGVIQWQRILGGSSTDEAEAVAVDSSDDVYLLGVTQSEGGGTHNILLAKYNSSGTLQWQRILGGSSAQFGYALSFDSSDNVYVLGNTFGEGAGSADLLLAKYNSSGALQWQRILGGSGAEVGYGAAVDSDSNLYVLGSTSSQGAGSSDILLAKYNSSGTLQWQRILGGSDPDQGFKVKLDADNNPYVLGETESAGEGGKDWLLAKYNSSGTLQFQRVLGASGSDDRPGLAISSDGSIHILGETNSAGEGGNDLFVSALPSDGSLTGTYELDGVNFVYAVSTLTAATSTLTAATSTRTAATSTLTAATSTLTAGSASLTEHLVEL